jgi:hypothetical protein
MTVRHVGKTLYLKDAVIELEHEILDAFELDDVVVVLFDPDAFIRKFGQFHNLIAADHQGKRLWDAELPTTSSGDCYYKATPGSPITAYSMMSYICKIDPVSGKILGTTFTK